MNDALDFLAITFVLGDIARTFGVALDTASLLLLATYGVRWIGGLAFGGLSDRIGRKIPLLITLTWFTAGAVATGFFSIRSEMRRQASSLRRQSRMRRSSRSICSSSVRSRES
ncbi:hypothetical protein [Caballeronia sp. NK8]|uniref:hypothetical protein n=1 Tax=Caballeronia sp. NK8 TaxID=140098 RepID=UPI001CED63C2|nr:hypothetical protein [Caballeronia sp. NK8]